MAIQTETVIRLTEEQMLELKDALRYGIKRSPPKPLPRPQIIEDAAEKPCPKNLNLMCLHS